MERTDRAVFATDIQSYVVRHAALILEICKRVEPDIKEYLEDWAKKPEITADLLSIFMLADDLLQLAEPDQSAGEFHGLPREVTGAGSSAEFVGWQGWDFRPWFGEKASHVKHSARVLIDYWGKDPAEVTLHESAPISEEEWVRDGILSGLHGVKRDTQKIFEMTVRDKVTIMAGADDQEGE